MVLRYAHLAPDHLAQAAELCHKTGHTRNGDHRERRFKCLIPLVVREGLEPSTPAL